jgi:hypothetical protein
LENANMAVKPKTWVKRLGRVLFLASVSLMALYFVGRLVWRFSGSNQWELEREERGVKMYYWKTPGIDVKKYKGVVRIHSQLATLVKMTQDPDLCLDAGCKEAKMLERVDDQLQYYSFKFNLPAPFKPREFVVREQYYQNPKTKDVLLEVVGAPDKIPPNDCCFRVSDINNTWRFTPLGKGEVEVEWMVNMNEGGFLPDLFLNKRSRAMFPLLHGLQAMADRQKYQNAKFDFVKEE